MPYCCSGKVDLCALASSWRRLRSIFCQIGALHIADKHMSRAGIARGIAAGSNFCILLLQSTAAAVKQRSPGGQARGLTQPQAHIQVAMTVRNHRCAEHRRRNTAESAGVCADECWDKGRLARKRSRPAQFVANFDPTHKRAKKSTVTPVRRSRSR